ncbi:MAG TPA: arylesterase [Pseudomonas sp.]|nr:arylesterase [Pseudomonas sp.]
MRAWILAGGLACLLWGQSALAGTLVVVGDSISAALGLDTSQGWVALLERRLAERGLDHQVVNASVSGDTTAGGRARLPRLLAEHRPDWVVIELGGNDGLRGLPTAQLRQNLEAMIRDSQENGAQVILLGMRLPPNYGARYNRAFEQVFADLAQEYRLPWVPFFLEGVGGVEGMMQADGIHPAAKAQSRLLDNFWPVFKPLL